MRRLLGRVTDQLSGLVGNLSTGARWCLLLPARGRLSSGPGQAILLVLVAVAAVFAYDYLLILPPRTLKQQALNRFAAVVLLGLFTAYLVDRGAQQPGGPLRWFVAMSCRVFGDVLGSDRPRGLVFAAAVLWVFLRAAGGLPEEPFWRHYEPYTPPAINVETTFHAQPGLVAKALADVEVQRAGIDDLYFVGLAGDAEEEALLHEVQFARSLFDRRFDTAHRSLALINHASTVDRTPIADAHNLRDVPHRIGKLMNPEEDILFLFLSSHGFEDHELWIDFYPLTLNNLTAKDVKSALDDSGIKWRVIVISSCYSGGFIETLRDDFSLILTDANAEGVSYFGQATGPALDLCQQLFRSCAE